MTLRNAYGSTEGLEQNIQEILFDAEPNLPSRSPKDVAAEIALVPAAWIASHGALAVLLFLVIAAVIWFARRRKRQP